MKTKPVDLNTVKIFEAQDPLRIYPSDNFVILEQLEDGNYRALESWAKRLWAESAAKSWKKKYKKNFVVVDRNCVPIP